jgi:hypothetical protein
MAVQSMVALGFILFSAGLAAFMTRRHFLGRWSWIVANAFVVLGGVLALSLAQDWAGWLTAALFAFLVLAPSALLDRARLAAQRGQWGRAARLHFYALVFHPSPWTRFGLTLRRALSKDATLGYAAALTRIEATGSQKQRALVRLMLAHEQRDWERLLTLARTGSIELSEAKPREVRALGELGRVDEMVRAYQGAEEWLLLQTRQECMLYVLAFTGRLEGVRNLLDGPLSATDDESKAYWMAVTRLRTDRGEEAARSILRGLSETASDRVRRSARWQLQQACQEGEAWLPLADETERIVNALNHGLSQRLRGRQDRMQRLKWSTKAHLRGLMLLMLIVIVAVVARYCRQ